MESVRHFRLRSLRSMLGMALLILMASSFAAPAAQAGTIRYSINSDPMFFTVDNDTGIVKLTYNGCVTAGQRQTINFVTNVNVSKSSPATFKVLREEGETPNSVFTPPTVNLVQGPDQSFNASLSFTLSTPTNNTTTFRFKLDPDSGEGLGEGPGVMVNIPCVQPAALGAAGQPVTAAGPVPVVPIPSAVLGAAAGPARCITVDKLTVRAGVNNRVVVTVVRNGAPVSRAYVRLRGAGVDLAKFTGASGRAIFTVKPRRRGTVFVQSNVCRGADRIAVAGAAASPVSGGGANLTG